MLKLRSFLNLGTYSHFCRIWFTANPSSNFIKTCGRCQKVWIYNRPMTALEKWKYDAIAQSSDQSW